MTDPVDPYDDTLAAEYVLHLLDPQERRAFADRLRDEAQLRDLVLRWEARLAPIADDVVEIAPPPHVKAAILKRIAPELPKQSRTRGWMIGLLGLAAAMVIVFIALGPILRGPVDLSPQFQSELASADGTIILVAGVIPPTHEIVIDRIAGALDEGRVWELWLIADGSSVPVSLGLLEREGTTRIRVPDAIAPGVRTGTIAISDEPLGGSPTGLPTGAILATGTFSDI